ncbi:SDR family NAD(P)-dependent oxidoreductase [Edaphobacter albus]|uniref:SDR family NAD(P)-dependent oxidoreductase n=1 Tax=Edaphobacter sp. 4G125 TaxID=2763071 RepID=UPI001647C7B1|nr:SDR family oxidoreductase [Edaphobacter sp. 4G125]QNI35810.1 SDR family oxidoreductase [Edaphobacter sp. 4G125]
MTNNPAAGISLAGKTALVTGASSGIGAASAVALGKAGAYVIVHYNSQETEAKEVLAQLRVAGADGEIVQADLSTRSGTDSLCAFASSREIDILVNNAGSLVQRTRVLDFTHELWEKVMMLNLTSAFFLSQAAVRGMAERKSGVIINMSSVAARFGGGLGALAYSSAKAAVSAMTKGLTKEFAPQGVRVNCISPGTIDTGYHRAFSTTEGLDGVRSATPIGRLGTSEEIADLVVFLASDRSTFIHGQVIEINGGFLMA